MKFCFLALSLLLLALPRLAVADFPAISKDDIQSSLDANRADWEQKMGTARPRLFFGGNRLDQVKQKFAADPAAKAEILALAQQIMAKPVRPYATPAAEVAAHHTTEDDSHQELWERNVGDDLQVLSFADLLEDTPELRQRIKETVLTACGYPTWGEGTFKNHDLACAHLAEGISMAWDWHHDLWSDTEQKTIIQTMQARMGDMYAALLSGAFWSRSFTDNHNQNDMSGLGLAGLSFYTEIPDAPLWLAAARLDIQNAAKYSADDGGSPEGVPYWSYGRTNMLLFIEGTSGVLDTADLYDQPFLKNAASYRLYSSVAGFSGILPWGDAPTQDFCGPQHILNRMAAQYHDSSAQWLSQALPFKPRSNILVWADVWKDASVPADKPPQVLDYHAWVGDIATSRSGWGPADYTLAVKSGYTNRNHCHLDAGALIFAIGGDWLLTAPGYGRGAGTPGFWDSKKGRWDFYSNSTEAENTLLIDGHNQSFDPDARGTIDTFFVTPSVVWTGVDLTQAYNHVSNVRREVIHRRGDYVLVLDHASADHPIDVDWLAQPSLPMHPDGNALVVGDEEGQLRVEMVAPAQPFKPRAPTSPKVDNLPESIHTQTVSQKGVSVRFVTLLVPTLAGNTPAELHAEVIEKLGAPQQVVIHAKDWTDHIYRSDKPASIAQDGVKMTACAADFRVIGHNIDTCVALQTTSFSLGGMSVHLTVPQNIALQRMGDDGWILDSDALIGSYLSLPPGYSLLPLSRPDEVSKSGATYRYFVSTSGAPREKAQDWLAAQVVFRKEPEPKIVTLPDQPPAPASVVVAVEAEDYVWQRHGLSEKVIKPGASAGYALKSFGSGSARQAVDWKFNVPKAGRYVLKLRYCSLGDTGFAILLDGAALSKDALHISVPGTGGWSSDRDDWSEITLADAQGKPLLFPLTAGPHEICLTNPVHDINLDKVTLQGAGK